MVVLGCKAFLFAQLKTIKLDTLIELNHSLPCENKMLRYKCINVEQKTNDEIFQILIEFIGKNIGQIFAKKYVTNNILIHFLPR